MKISELMKQLQHVFDVKGDIDIAVVDKNRISAPISHIRFHPEVDYECFLQCTESLTY